MTLAHSHIGIDVSKAWLDIFDAASGTRSRCPNTPEDIARWVAALPASATVLFEATAPYDTALRRALAHTPCCILRVNPARARAFARAAGFLAKTDTLDARMLAAMAGAIEMSDEPPYDEEREAVIALHRRRDQLVEVRAVERGRIRDVVDPQERASIERMLKVLDGEITRIERQMRSAIGQPAFARKAALLASLKGVGEVTIATLIALLPELGQRSHKTIAALAGLAPVNCDSGTFRGQRHIQGGRRRVRQACYMATLSVIRVHPAFKARYEAIKARSGHAKVAIIAVARKLLVTLNAMMRTGEPFRA